MTGFCSETSLGLVEKNIFTGQTATQDRCQVPGRAEKDREFRT